MDPAPELPLNHIGWGNPVHLKTPCSSYKAQYIDPKQVIADKRLELQAVREDQLEDLILMQIDQQIDGDYLELASDMQLEVIEDDVEEEADKNDGPALLSLE